MHTLTPGQSDAELESHPASARVALLVRAEQVQVIFRQAPPAMLISVVVAALVCSTLWSVTEKTKLEIWFAASVFIALVRVAIVVAYRRKAPQGLDPLKWEKPFLVSLVCSALVWGVGGLFIMPSHSLTHQAILYFFLMGMTAGSAALYSAHKLGVSITILAILTPATIVLLFQDGLIPRVMAIGGGIYALSTFRATTLISFFLHRSFHLAELLRAAHQDAERLARTDELTGMYNRRAFQELGNLVITQARLYSQELCLVLLDVDYFKKINDTRGHAAGDAALIHLAGLIQSHKRDSDVACRIGGEEFAILLPGTSAPAGRGFAEDLRKLIEKSPVPGPESFSFTSSFGVANGCSSLEQLLAEADACLYEAKAKGRNCVVDRPGAAALEAGA